MQLYDYLIVGSGLYGATFAYLARQSGKRCLVIDKRPHLGGNVYCENIEGINVHKYGAHIFHTSNEQVWKMVNGIVPFNRYTNSPIANYKGKLYNLPFNMNTFHQMWGVNTPSEAMEKIAEQRQDALQNMKAAGVSEPRNLEEQALLLIGKDLYEVLVKHYTEKQWGRNCAELPAFIIKRLPVRFVYDNNYFGDRFQGIPIGGYNRLIGGMLAGADALTGTDFFDLRRSFDRKLGRWEIEGRELHIGCNRIVFTGRIDEFFGYEHGKLEYRSLRFEEKTIDLPNFQGNAVMNFTSADVPYTRIIEHKHFEAFGEEVYSNPKTVISTEFPTEWRDGMEPFYPVNDERNNRLAALYRQMGEGMPNVVFGGRLAEYKYYDMAPIVEKVLGLFNEN